MRNFPAWKIPVINVDVYAVKNIHNNYTAFQALFLLWHRTKRIFKALSIRNYYQIGCIFMAQLS